MACWSCRAHRRRRARQFAIDGPGRLHGHGRRVRPGRSVGSTTTVESALTDYDSRRKPRTKWVQQESIAAAESLRTPPSIRNAVVARTGRPDDAIALRTAHSGTIVKIGSGGASWADAAALARVDKAAHGWRRAPAAAISQKNRTVACHGRRRWAIYFRRTPMMPELVLRFNRQDCDDLRYCTPPSRLFALPQ